MSIYEAACIIYGSRNEKTYEVSIIMDGSTTENHQIATAREVSDLLHDIGHRCLPLGMVFVDGVAVKRFGKALK